MSAVWDQVQTTVTAGTGSQTLVIPLPNEAVLTVQGVDAHKFLQGQCTTDMDQVTAHASRLGCFANLKGRAIASFRAVQWGGDGDLHLVMDAPLADTMRAILQKYIVFSKAQLAMPELAVFGVLGECAAMRITEVFGECPELTDGVVCSEQAVAVRLHGGQRFLVLATADGLKDLWPQLTADAAIGDLNQWRLAQIEVGEPQVLAATSELFQPQELNLPVLNGVSYNKGCYTGQEIIARLHFRGKLKQWTHRFLAHAATCPALNAPLTDEAGQVQGQVVLTAKRADHLVELLAIARHDRLEGLHLPDHGQALEVLRLPYHVEVKE